MPPPARAGAAHLREDVGWHLEKGLRPEELIAALVFDLLFVHRREWSALSRIVTPVDATPHARPRTKEYASQSSGGTSGSTTIRLRMNVLTNHRASRFVPALAVAEVLVALEFDVAYSSGFRASWSTSHAGMSAVRGVE